jgi:hypothetical protein
VKLTDKLVIIETGNKEILGKYFFDKAINFSLKKEFGKAYEFIKLSLDLITCDCSFVDWDLKFDKLDKSIINDFSNSTANHTEYLFVKSVLIAYSKDLKNPYIELDAVESYIEKESDEYGYYIKGKLLQKLDKNLEALDNYYLSHEIAKTSKTFYRIGRIKEQFFNQYGLDFLYYALIKNSSSSCCAKELKLYYNKSDLVINESQSAGELWKSFENKEIQYLKFWLQHFRMVKNQISSDNTINHNNVVEIQKYTDSLRNNESIFLIQENLDNNYSYYDDDHDYDNGSSNSIYDNEYYNDALDMDQQSPDFWDSI